MTDAFTAPELLKILKYGLHVPEGGGASASIHTLVNALILGVDLLPPQVDPELGVILPNGTRDPFILKACKNHFYLETDDFCVEYRKGTLITPPEILKELYSRARLATRPEGFLIFSRNEETRIVSYSTPDFVVKLGLRDYQGNEVFFEQNDTVESAREKMKTLTSKA